MPRLSRNAIAAYLHSECQRRLALDMWPSTAAFAAEREALGMPPENVRPGIQILRETGNEWQRQKLSDLAECFGRHTLIGRPRRAEDGCLEFSPIPMEEALAEAVPGRFVVEGRFCVGRTFERAIGAQDYRNRFHLEYSELQPDLVHVLSPGTFTRGVRPDGGIETEDPGDALGLQVIDIKLTAEPTVPYYVQVTYYAMALAGWLEDRGLAGRYRVVPDAAVWPGSHDASQLMRFCRQCATEARQPTLAELVGAFGGDLEVTTFEVFAPRLRRFFAEDLLHVLDHPWRELDWHVDNRCQGCEYLGMPWPGVAPHPEHCYPMAAENGHLSRVAFVSRGARVALEQRSIRTVGELADVAPDDPAFDEHYTLRATRTVVGGRARSLERQQAEIPDRSGTSAVMPRWADLSLFLVCEFDVGSGITVCFGLQGFRYVREADLQPGHEQIQPLRAQTFPVIDRAVEAEAEALIGLLRRMREAMEEARGAKPGATVQVYVWDSVTYEHLVRVIGRHLGDILGSNQLRDLAWVFPPEELLPNPDLVERTSPITVVRDVIRAVVAAPVPHYYSLLNVARQYHGPDVRPPFHEFHVNALFEDPLSDHVPMERAHEIWTRAMGRRPWNEQLRTMETTVRTKLQALSTVKRRLQDDLNGQLSQTAPRIVALGAPAGSARMSSDGLLWYSFAKLNAALDRLRCHQVRAMPPHERTARFESARLLRRLDPAPAAEWLRMHEIAVFPARWVFALAPDSREVKARDGDIGFALAPTARPGFLDQGLNNIAMGRPVPLPGYARGFERMERVSAVAVKRIARDEGIIALDVRQEWLPTLQALEGGGLVDFSQDVMLEPAHRDYLCPRLKSTLEAIGNPPAAGALAAVEQAIGRRRRPARALPTPVAEVLWSAGALAAQGSGRNLEGIRDALIRSGVGLNASQWMAWQHALEHQLTLVWGPPGTGKSRTMQALLFGALHAARQSGHPQRVLLTGPTYEAIDNVLGAVAQGLRGEGGLGIPQAQVWRLRSRSRQPTDGFPQGVDVTMGDDGQVAGIRTALRGDGLVLVATTPQQVHALLTHSGGAPVQPLFDLIVIDEASQMDVAGASLVLAARAERGSVVVAGDPKQLPPIHQAEPPLGLDSMVGPIYSYLEERHQVQPCVLEENYRSNECIVEFARAAGYPAALRSVHPRMAIQYSVPLETGAAAPVSWPEDLYWTPEWSSLLREDQPCCAFIYREGRSSQSNRFEADAVAALTWMLRHHMDGRVAGIEGEDGEGRPYSPLEFWREGVGIVTPHRAQQALIVGRLQRLFGTEVEAATIRAAVDTVERFQGQERRVILASFAVGDPDAIRDEDEFLLSLNRFNVMCSRAKAKLIVLVTQDVVDYLASDPDVLRESALLKTYVEYFCSEWRSTALGFMRDGAVVAVPGKVRWRSGNGEDR